MIKFKYCSALLLLVTHVSFAQKVALDEYNRILETWYEGKVILNDGISIAGQVQYNHFDATVRIKNDDGTRSFNTRTVQSFEFDDKERGRRRKILTIPYDVLGKGTDELLFFEVLKEFESFALLSRVSGLIAKSTMNDPSNYQLPFEAEQVEYLYVFDDQGNSKLIMEVKYEENSLFYSTKTQFATTQVKTRIKESEPFKEYINGPDYAKLEIYAKENKLSFKDRNDLIIILDQYERMLRNEEN